jgi:hypothetical protein
MWAYVENVILFYPVYFPAHSLLIIFPPFSFVLAKSFDILVLTQIGLDSPHLGNQPIYYV